MHSAGRAAEADKIVEVAHARGVKVLEDCSQSHGAKIVGRPVGTFGRIGDHTGSRSGAPRLALEFAREQLLLACNGFADLLHVAVLQRYFHPRGDAPSGD